MLMNQQEFPEVMLENSASHPRAHTERPFWMATTTPG